VVVVVVDAVVSLEERDDRRVRLNVVVNAQLLRSLVGAVHLAQHKRHDALKQCK
jgi:hypothetical protein